MSETWQDVGVVSVEYRTRWEPVDEAPEGWIAPGNRGWSGSALWILWTDGSAEWWNRGRHVWIAERPVRQWRFVSEWRDDQ